MPESGQRSHLCAPELRASDDEREQIVVELREHYGAGRLSEAELTTRVASAYRARTRSELGVLTLDLPSPEIALPTDVPRRPAREVTRAGRGLRVSFRIHLVVYLIVSGALVGIWSIAGGGYFWPAWALVGWGIGVGAHLSPIVAGVGTRRRRSPARSRLTAPAVLCEVASGVAADPPNLRPVAAPDGTVTIMFSDIEGSTQLNERLGDARWLALLMTHHRILREEVRRHGGYEVKVEGDGFMVAFAGARSAVRCALDIQAAIAAEFQARPDGAIRVRIGVHTGEALQQEGDFYGTAVVLAARITGLADGGEILISATVKQLIESGGDIRVGDEREVELRGLAGTHRVHRVDPASAS